MGYERRMYPQKCVTGFGIATVTVKCAKSGNVLASKSNVNLMYHQNIMIKKLAKGDYIIEVQAGW